VRGVSFAAEPGSLTAIAGRSGAGKSSLVNLLFRFYEYQQGGIMIDGREIRDYDRKYLRSRIGLITQETFLFGMDVADNIRLGNPCATEAEITAAAKKAYAHEFITRLPDGYHTRIGERGAMISGGQAQRLALARVILKSPTILVLDEAMSALDSEAEKNVMTAIKGAFGDRTIILISHRLTSIRDADRIVCLDEGQVAGVGSHGELYRECPVYRKLYDEQYAEETAGEPESPLDLRHTT
jgi:ABC-type multidrug transport system fused ATPase/permease subunit